MRRILCSISDRKIQDNNRIQSPFNIIQIKFNSFYVNLLIIKTIANLYKLFIAVKAIIYNPI